MTDVVALWRYAGTRNLICLINLVKEAGTKFLKVLPRDVDNWILKSCPFMVQTVKVSSFVAFGRI